MDALARWNGVDIYVMRGDITTLRVDAIVNAANKWLQGGGGVDGAIHRRGGPAILQECQQIVAKLGGFLPTGEAVITTGGDLPAKHVIHTVGPIYSTEKDGAADLLAAAYRNSLAVARAHLLRSLAFPCISTGAFGYPADEACAIAVRTVRLELEAHGGFERVVFCTFDPRDEALYRRSLRKADEDQIE